MAIDEALRFIADARASYDETEAGEQLGRWWGLHAEDLLFAGEALAGRVREADELGVTLHDAISARGDGVMVPYRLAGRVELLLKALHEAESAIAGTTATKWEELLKGAEARGEKALREALDIADELAAGADGACVCGRDIMSTAEHHADGCRYAKLRGLAGT
jgi:hypothetical protein